MSTRRNNGFSKADKVCGPNWILIAGGALLSTFSIRFAWRLRHSSHPLSNSSSLGFQANGTSEREKSLGCCLHSSKSSCAHNDEYCCFHSNSGTEHLEGKEEPNEQMVSASDTSLPLVTLPAPLYSKEDGVMWTSSPDRLELPPKPYNHHSTCSDSPCVSETSSDIFSKREVIQKLRQQLKRRDDMILEMQEQILELQNSYNAQRAHSSHLQAQVDSMNRDLFESEREVERLRKAIADHSVGCTGSNGKTSPVAPWSNGFMESENNYESVEKGSRDGERIEMLRKEVEELKEVIDGKEYLLRNYKEQKIELSQKVKELQQRLDSQFPNIL
ncbi:uncharacterized protein LOC103861705 isoform X1 [Brassica rapa]|uniref:BnaA03g48690D protein n=3 Tax=Brassica TaxID=3705 RepID=A0A078GZ32_BRANA|nr:uncharacterized protein LOC103861705 isoform X1 [Brassica rapa]XP_009137674.1 uncharacterized protein LOC103861705 isoform X1 [Brassica rapa]XP_013738197.1 uncharacterized protein BNAA03G48690D [Brassica napus]XP_013738198.1 uncharacterized protein BNAA03G48690D [Brassica napus]XP_013738199.1 uncharacterized protein BNAA03G48690D [Brassica napus]XP_018513252.1 uncharacterized protein LOC103861705 isoform X1 [Brassica rapa]KAH0935666.1 hypothetical protein HID58_012783 [Brassica napus]CAF2